MRDRGCADPPIGPATAAIARQNPQIDLGESQFCLGASGGNDAVERKRNFQPAANSNAVNANDGRHIKRVNPVEQTMHHLHMLQHIICGREQFKFGDIGAINETTRLARQHANTGNDALALDPVNNLAKFTHHRMCQNIHRFAGHIQNQPA